MARFQRARKPEEKAQRRAAILRAARALAVEMGPIALSLSEVARRARISKPSIYRYFESREEILLCLCVDELGRFADRAEAELTRPVGVERVAERVATAMLAQPLLCQLLGMVAGILEHNLGTEAIARAKCTMYAHSARFAGALRRAQPALSDEETAWAGMTIALYVAALWPAAHPSRAAAEVQARPEFAWARIDAATALRRFIATLLRGV